MEGLESTYDRRKSLLEATIDDEEQLAAALARIEGRKRRRYRVNSKTKNLKRSRK